MSSLKRNSPGVIKAMKQTEHTNEKRHELISVAKSMQKGEMNLIEGVRRLCALRFAVGDPENEVFLTIRGIDSETDAFPLGTMREYCDSEYLRRMDDEMEKYLSEAHNEILQACREIVSTFS